MTLGFREIKNGAGFNDVAHIISSWVNQGDSLDRNAKMSPVDYFEYMKIHVVKLLSQKGVFVTILFDDIDPSFVIAYLVHSIDVSGNLIVHFTFVDKAVRSLGHCKRLIEHVFPGAKDKTIFASTYFKYLTLIMNKHKNLRFNPYATIAEPKKEPNE